ncbi:hypothetical protein [Clostridium sp. AN503]|uniref:hypothetical protein n=1 Tax=Clostridium sp. AN503 TaxID=3160598 RepID=UPI00345A40B1
MALTPKQKIFADEGAIGWWFASSMAYLCECRKEWLGKLEIGSYECWNGSVCDPADGTGDWYVE